MTRRLVIMVEESSMAEFINSVLPRAFPDWKRGQDWLVIPHKGKSDLETSFPRKMAQWKEPGIRFLIMRDNDGGNCRRRKSELETRVPKRVTSPYRIRIVCQQLESWLMGDPEALAEAYPKAARAPLFARWTKGDPDKLSNASELMERLTGTRAKIARSHAIACCSRPSSNRSRSFQVFLGAVKSLLS